MATKLLCSGCHSSGLLRQPDASTYIKTTVLVVLIVLSCCIKGNYSIGCDVRKFFSAGD